MVDARFLAVLVAATTVASTASAQTESEATPAAQPRPVDASSVRSSKQTIKTVKDAGGWKLQVNGEDFMVLGMNWAYMPIGENYTYDFWNKPDQFIIEALEGEMSLLRDMGVNTLRVYTGIPRRWITYIYEKYGIWTVLNHSMGRYGHLVDGVYVDPTNYADPRTREVLREEIVAIAREYKDTPGLLMWLLGNENNYGLYWSSAETEDLPEMEAQDARAVHLYTLYGEIIDAIHEVDRSHPVAIANGDLQFIELIAKHAPNLDVMGSNVYRGLSSGDLFDRVAEVLDVPFMYTEFGSDAYNAREEREDHIAQAEYVRALWQEIYEHSHGKGRAGNAIGGMTFQWSDGWWKYRQDVNLDVHDTNASWGNGAYRFDFVDGQNNMNEEWFGICAKGLSNEEGLYRVYPRAAYYVLREGYQLDPYAADTTLERVRQHWGNIRVKELGTPYEAQSAKEAIRVLEMVFAANLTMEFETFTTDGRNLDDPDDPERGTNRFDHLESMYLGFELQPTSKVRGTATVNVLGNVPQNPINEIYFEDRGLPETVLTPEGDELVINDLERIKLYQATLEWRDDWFELEGYYRTGHYHWGYEGDFFGIYPEANYVPDVDRFNANTPNGFVVTGKKWFDGLKIAAGPEIFWGANPTVIAKYYREVGSWKFSLMHQEDIAQRAAAPTSSALPLPKTRKTAVYLSKTFGRFKFEIGGIMAGTDRLDRFFTSAEQVGSDSCIEQGGSDCGGFLGSGFEILDDKIDIIDTLGARAKLTYSYRNINLYVQGGYRGLVADGGSGDPTITFTGFSLRDTGVGNNYNIITGGAFNFGHFQIAPNFMFMKPLEGPLPPIPEQFDPATGEFFAGVRPRNLLQDPFWVRANRETIGFEMMLGYDPTPATWNMAWDNARREDAEFAAWINFVYRVLPTIQDAGVGVQADGTFFPFPTSAPARDLWEIRGRMIMNPTTRTHIVIDGYGGTAQPTGDDTRLITRAGANARLTYRRVNLEGMLKINDWGPYDFQRDFNLTFPLQTMIDLSYGLSTPQWFVQAYTRIGAAFQYRILDEFSPRYRPDPEDPDRLGNEWELRTYVHITL